MRDKVVFPGSFLFCNLLVLSLVTFYFILNWHPGLSTDGHGYLDTTNSILNLTYFSPPNNLSDVNESIIFRTPLYPLMLSPFVAIFGDTSLALFLTHLIFTLIVFAHVIRSFKKIINPILMGFLLMLASSIPSRLFNVVLTEWIGYLLILFSFASIFKLIQNPQRTNAIMAGIALASLPLLRPVYMWPVFISLVFIFSMPHLRANKLRYYLITFTIVPLIVWMSINKLRINTFSISPLGSYNLCGVSQLIGSAYVKPQDLPLTIEFIKYANFTKIPPLQQENLWIKNISKNYYLNLFDRNLNMLRQFAIEHNLSWIELNNLAFQYAIRSIPQNLENYILYIYFGISSCWWAALLGVFHFLFGLYRIKIKKDKLLAIEIAGSIIIIISLGSILLSAMVISVQPRFKSIGEAPILFYTLVWLCSIIQAAVRVRGSRLNFS